MKGWTFFLMGVSGFWGFLLVQSLKAADKVGGIGPCGKLIDALSHS